MVHRPLMTGRYYRERGPLRPRFFCAYCQLIIPRPAARAPCQTYRPARTMQGDPPAAGQSPPDNRPTGRRTLTPDRGPNAKTQHLVTGPMRCRTTSSVARTADRGRRTGKNGTGPVAIGSFFPAKKSRGAAKFSRPAALRHECLCHVSRK